MDELWRNASRTQRVRAIAGAAVVAWAGALVVDMHYLRARPEFAERFPGAAAEPGNGLGLFGGLTGKSKQQQQQEEDAAARAEPEWRRARREREQSSGGVGGGGEPALATPSDARRARDGSA
jgi:hypothetical protein